MTETSARTTGILYIVATPIGHREDISQRALDTLRSVNFILAEDTRHSRVFLNFLGINQPLLSMHAHNEEKKCEHIIERLIQGESCALISDAGTPLISDPGYPLVKRARAQGISVIPIPGACALITALSAAGVPCDMFTFCGFLPAKKSARQHKLEHLKTLEHTLVFYESTHRILDCMDDIALVFGESCPIVLVKELTKAFERFISNSCTEVKNWLLIDDNHIKGEFVLIIPPRDVNKNTDSHEEILSILLSELPLKQAVKLTSQITKSNKNELYQMALHLHDMNDKKR